MVTYCTTTFLFFSNFLQIDGIVDGSGIKISEAETSEADQLMMKSHVFEKWYDDYEIMNDINELGEGDERMSDISDYEETIKKKKKKVLMVVPLFRKRADTKFVTPSSSVCIRVPPPYRQLFYWRYCSALHLCASGLPCS